MPAGEQREHPAGDGELEIDVRRLPEPQLEPRAEAERQARRSVVDRDDAAREADAGERRDGADGGAQVAVDDRRRARAGRLRSTQIRASSGPRRAIDARRSPGRARETTNESAPCRTTATGRSGTTVTRSVCG